MSPLTIAITVTLWASLVSLGAGSTHDALLSPLRHRGAVLRIVVFDAVVVPPLAWLIVTLTGIPEGFAIGLLLVGTASAGPLGLVAVRMARANANLALAVVGILELANLAVIPFWSAVLLPRTAVVPVAEIARGLVLWLALPFAVGLLVAALAPRIVPTVTRLATPVATGGWLVAIAMAVAGSWSQAGTALGSGVLGASVLLAVTCLAGGWLVARGPVSTRAAGALVTGQRGNAIALGIAGAVFADVPQAALAVVLFSTLVSVLVPATALVLRGRQPSLEVGRAA